MKIIDNPSYVVINDEKRPLKDRHVLRTPTKAIRVPLSKRDQEIADVLERKFDAEENCAGLAAPQIGFSKPIIVFAANDDPELRKWRKDFSQYIPKTIWINPSYEPVDDDMHEDFEGCFSVNDLAGKVKRYKRVRYEATLLDGTSVSGMAEGFLARIIQHEVDHLRGILFIDKATEGSIFSISEYEKLREKKKKE